MIVVEKLPDTIRIRLDREGLPSGFSVLVVPDKRVGVNYRDFYLTHEKYGPVRDMFGCDVTNDGEAVQIAEGNAAEYISFYVAEYFDEE